MSTQYQNPDMAVLQGYLSLKSPSDTKTAPSMFDFERFRDVKINWFDITSQKNVGPNPIDDIKDFFINNWKGSISKDQEDIFKGEMAFYDLKNTTATRKEIFWKEADVYLNGNSKVKFPASICLIHKPSNRLFVLVDKNFTPATATSLGWVNTITINDAWASFDSKNYSFSMVQAYEVDMDAENFATKTTYIKREAIIFKEEYERLNSQLAFIAKFNSASDKYVDSIVNDNNNFKKFWDDEEELDKAGNVYSNLKTKAYSVMQKMRQLAAKVKDYGYFLALNTETISTTPPVSVKAGTIYQIRQDTYMRRDVIRRQEWRTVRDGKNSYSTLVWVEEPIWVPTTYTNYVEVNLLDDPIQRAIDDLNKKNYKVYFGRRKNGGFFTEEGVAIADVLKRCANDEAFRRQCAVIIPQYDYLISNKTYYLGAFVFINPLPGLIPTQYPSVGLREELSYRLAWKGTELGQLVSSINLAPGETRTITVSSKFKQTTSQTSTFKSINDLNTSQSFDLATEFEKEASQEFNRSDSMSASVSGSYGVGPFSASASASGSRSSSLKNFSKEMSRVAKKSSQSINSKLSQEVTSASSLSTEVSQETNKSITITNINKGSTLNLLFYQVYNRYNSALFLTNLELQVSSTTELIAGSGIYETYSYRITELKGDVFESLHPDRLPGKNPAVPAPGAPGTDPVKMEWDKYWAGLLKALVDTLQEDYDEKNPDSPRVIRFSLPTSFPKYAAKVLSTKDSGSKRTLEKLSGEVSFLDVLRDSELSVCEFSALLAAGAPSLEVINNPINPENLLIASGGLYVDSNVGIIPATENYSENMRRLETLRVESEIDKITAANEDQRARTNILLKGDAVIKQIIIMTEHNAGQDVHKVLLQLTNVVADANWRVLLDGVEVDNCIVDIPHAPAKASSITITWPGETPAQQELDDKLLLVHKTTGQILKKF